MDNNKIGEGDRELGEKTGFELRKEAEARRNDEGKRRDRKARTRKPDRRIAETTVGFEVTKVPSLMLKESSLTLFENLVWMTSAEAAFYLRKSYGALRVMVCRGYIKPKMFRRRWYFRRNELDRLIENSK